MIRPFQIEPSEAKPRAQLEMYALADGAMFTNASIPTVIVSNPKK